MLTAVEQVLILKNIDLLKGVHPRHLIGLANVTREMKWYRNLVVAQTVVETLEALKPRYPVPVENLSRIKVT